MRFPLWAGLFCYMALCLNIAAAEPPAQPPLMQDGAGKTITTRAQWQKRREELRAVFLREIYGEVPDTPYKLSWKVEREDPAAMGGKATLRVVKLTIAAAKGSLHFQLVLFVPNARKGQAPAFLLMNNRGPNNIDPDRKTKTAFWPAEEIVAAGFAAAAVQNQQIAADKKESTQGGIFAFLDEGKRDDASWGAIRAWAWGASRAMDYLASDKDIDAQRVAVIGHSRGGKIALVAAATDERFALACSNDSGCTGAALARRKQGETIAKINEVFPHWFAQNYRKYNDKDQSLPVDQHMLIALIAPRGVCVGSAVEDGWADPMGEFLAIRDAAPVWALYGKPCQLPAERPALDSPVSDGSLSYHIRTGKHDLTQYDWQTYLRFARGLFRMPGD